MLRKMFLFFLATLFILQVAGCATLRKERDPQLQQLQNQVSLLESQLKLKDEEVNSLRKTLSAKQEKERLEVRPASEVWMRPKTRDIQRALLGAGYNPGPIDGKMGRQTREAIRQFQRANNLSVDGKAGRKTWELLRQYLDKKIK